MPNVTKAEVTTALQCIVRVAKVLADEWKKTRQPVPETIVLLALQDAGFTAEAYEKMARILEKCGLERKNHAWAPNAVMRGALGA